LTKREESVGQKSCSRKVFLANCTVGDMPVYCQLVYYIAKYDWCNHDLGRSAAKSRRISQCFESGHLGTGMSTWLTGIIKLAVHFAPKTALSLSQRYNRRVVLAEVICTIAQ